jgi:hypothetical protein
MVEGVETGGLKRFDYSKLERGKLSDEERRGIKEAYGDYHRRRKKERLLRMILIVLFLVVFGVGAWILFVGF